MTNIDKTKPEKNPFLVSLGERIRSLRARRGVTRKALSIRAGVSERHLANLETGERNASIVVISQVANALNSTIAELTGDITTSSSEWLLIRSMLKNQDESSLREIRSELGRLLNTGNTIRPKKTESCIALIGLRGAGKSTLGKMLAADTQRPFLDMSSEIVKLAGCEISEIQNLYGLNAYRRYEKRALEEIVCNYPGSIIGTPGGIVSESDTFNFLLANCITVWLQATPEDHMSRVIEQGDLRPMAGNKEQAMEDLKLILSSREDFYSKSQIIINTSSQSIGATFNLLKEKLKHYV